MEHQPTGRSLLRISAWSVATVACAAIIGAASIVMSGWLLTGVEEANGGRHAAAERSAIGDYFGGISAVFSGMALLLLVATLMFQQRELRLQRHELSMQRQELVSSRDELRRSAESDMRALHVQLTQMAMDDPALADVWNDYPGESTEVVRQHLFANLVFGHYLLAYRWGGSTEAEVLAYARSLVRSAAFQRYWEASRAAKEELPADSAEGRLFRLFEQAIREAQDGDTPSPQ
uniref:DUF6082 family protein n=1 Tax=Streptomyces asoensis TaxID=249586 RepID=UPI00209C29E4|nr:DUF6082 family protein [Streptomyces asoensis]